MSILKWIIATLIVIALFLVVGSGALGNRSNEEVDDADLMSLLNLFLSHEAENAYRDILDVRKNKRSFYNNHLEIFNDYFFDDDSLPDERDVSLIVISYYLNKEANFALLDWNQANEDTLFFINEMIAEKGMEKLESSSNDSNSLILPVYLDPMSEEYLNTEEFIRVLDRSLENEAYGIVELGRGNDAYEVFLVEEKHLERLLETSKKLGFSMTSFSDN